MNRDDPATGYDLACDVQGLAGVIPVSWGQALVITDPPMTTWLPLPDGSGIDLVVPLEWGELSDDVLVKASRTAPAEAFEDLGLALHVGLNGAMLIAACDSGPDWVYERVLIPLPAGRHQVSAAEFEPDPYHLIRLYRLRRVS
jgi:hypothetical protein